MLKVKCALRLRAAVSVAATVLLMAGLLIAPAAAAEGASIAALSVVPSWTQGSQQAVKSHLIIENVGQYAEGARFLLKQGERRIWLTQDAVWLTVPDPRVEGGAAVRPVGRERNPAAIARPGTALRFTFAGANSTPTLEPYGPVPTKVSYLIGNDPAGWQTNVPVWSGVRYRDLYPGVDLVIGDGAGGAVPWRLEAQPGANLQAVALRAEGADSVTAEASGLRLVIKGRAINVSLPVWSLLGQPDLVGSTAVQQADGASFALAPASEPEAGTVETADAFEVLAAGDLVYNTPLAGSAYDAGYGIAVDAAGNAYITGESQSTNLPVTPGVYDPSSIGESSEAFVAKFDPAGTSLLYLTYLGGSGSDIGWGIALAGNLAYVVGETTSTNFPGMTGTVVGTDAFVAALNADATGVRYVTRLGGSAYDAGYGIAVEGLDAYLVGLTQSPDLPGTGCGGGASGDLVVAKFGPLGGNPVYATCLVNPDFEAGYGIAARGGAAYVVGETFVPATTDRDMVVARYDASGALSGGREIEGSADDVGKGVAVDGFGSIYVTGTTESSTSFPITPNTAPWGGGTRDAVVVKMSSDFNIGFATFLGGDGDDSGYGISVDTVQAMYVAGTTTSATFPMTAGAYDTALDGASDVFVARMHLQSAAQDKVTYATYLGGAYEDWGYGVATDTGGHAFVTGSSATSGNFDSNNAFVAKLKVSSPLGPPSPVSIGVSGSSALLTWPGVAGRSYYQVFRSTQPYFQPGDWSSGLPVSQPTATSYTDVNVLPTVNAYFYVVKTVNAAPAASANSNRVGKFTFQLVKGTP